MRYVSPKKNVPGHRALAYTKKKMQHVCAGEVQLFKYGPDCVLRYENFPFFFKLLSLKFVSTSRYNFARIVILMEYTMML